MTNMLDRLMGKRDVSTVDDYIELYNQFYYGGMAYGFTGGGGAPAVQQTLGGQITEPPPSNFRGMVDNAYRANGPIFSCELVRMSVFSSVRFTWQRMLKGAPSDFDANDPALRILQKPWANATTQDLLIRILLDADLAGNAYVAYDAEANELVRMRPDWVDIVLEKRMMPGRVDGGFGQVGYRKVGFLYTEGGLNSGNDSVGFLADEVAHFHPIPDPLSSYRGMSWLTPIIQEITADQSMTRHQRKFFDNGATVNLIVKYEKGVTLEKIKAFKELMDERHIGTENAYKTMHIAPGADPVPVGSNLRQIDFKAVRGAGETRIAAAAGVPPVIAGFSEGLEAATYSNYSQARRRFADGTMHPLWENIAGTLESIPVLKPFPGSRLWYDASGVPFLREDEKDAALIQQIQATTINTLTLAGWEKDSVVKAVLAQDWRLLKDSGLTSVQLFKPGEGPGANSVDAEDVSSEDGMTDQQRAWTKALESANGNGGK